MKSRRSASRSWVSATLRMVTKLPSDFDIFSPPKFTIPEWIQWRANWPSPKAPSDWAISFSWCGKMRSAPPPWMSNGSPR